MAKMKTLMECGYGTASVEEPSQTYHQRQMNHHSAKAFEAGRMSRNHALHGEAVTDDASGQHKELARAYGSAAKAHLSLADHHSFHFKKERSDSVKQMTAPPKAPKKDK